MPGPLEQLQLPGPRAGPALSQPPAERIPPLVASPVLGLMAPLAQGFPVGQVVPEARTEAPSHDVMGLQAHVTRSAAGAGVVVSRQHRLTPEAILPAMSTTMVRLPGAGIVAGARTKLAEAAAYRS